MAARSPGRPRSEEARRAILRAAVRLTRKHGYGALTMEGIARAAGVGKQTLYRWWPSKAAIVMEGLGEAAAEIAPLEETGSLETDLRVFVRRSVEGAGEPNTHLLAALMAEAQIDDEFGESFRRDFLAARRAVLAELLQRARTRGDLGKHADIAAVAEFVFASIWYRVLSANAPLDEAFAHRVADAALVMLRS